MPPGRKGFIGLLNCASFDYFSDILIFTLCGALRAAKVLNKIRFTVFVEPCGWLFHFFESAAGLKNNLICEDLSIMSMLHMLVLKSPLHRIIQCQRTIWSLSYDLLPIARPLDRSVARSLGRSVARSLDRSIARCLDRSVARSLFRSVARSLGHSVARSLDRSLERSIARSSR